MKLWLQVIMTSYLILGFCQVHDLVQEKAELVNQWIDLSEGEVTGKIVDENNTPLLAQVRFYDGEGTMLKRTQTDLNGDYSIRLAEGEYTLEVSKGYEYEVKTVLLEVKKESSKKIEEIQLKRIIDWRAKDYISGDLHQHSQFSEDGVNTVKEILYANVANGLDFGALSDYNTTNGFDEWMSLADELNFLALPAQEITTQEGSYLAINTTELMDLTKMGDKKILEDMIKKIQVQGGLIQVNHPEQNSSILEYASQFDAIEIWNGQAIAPISNLSDLNETFTYNHKSKEKWFELLSSGMKLTALGNSDNHDISQDKELTLNSQNEVFNEWISQGQYDGNPRNYIKVRDVTIDGIIEGIRKGHVFITNGPLMDITVNDATFGDALKNVSDAEISYIIASNDCVLDTLNIIADGKVIETIPLAEDIPTIGTLTLNLSNYRWIVFEVITKSYKYAISNPIYLN